MTQEHEIPARLQNLLKAIKHQGTKPAEAPDDETTRENDLLVIEALTKVTAAIDEKASPEKIFPLWCEACATVCDVVTSGLKMDNDILLKSETLFETLRDTAPDLQKGEDAIIVSECKERLSGLIYAVQTIETQKMQDDQRCVRDATNPGSNLRPKGPSLH
jgi:hypothetical protein